MAWADIDMGIFYPHTTISSGILMTKGSKGNLNYSVNDVDKEVGFATTHDQIKERWHFKSFATNLSSMVAGTPYRVNVRGSIKKLGDIPIAYWGLENIEYDKNVDQKPSNRYGFMYYYTAPDMEMVGNVTLADGFLHEIEGTAWFEHQWGNFQSPEQTKYFWGYARFPNGDVITWQQHYGNLGGKLNAAVSFNAAATNFGWKDPHIEQNRFAFIPKDQPPQYTFGSEFVFTPIKWWTSLKSNITYPWWGQLKTPKGTFYLSPASQPAQEIISLEGAFIEGAMVLHNDSINGPVVAHGFCELVQLPALWAKYSNGLPERAVSENSYLDSV
jgi:hypothetical protein